MPIQDSDVVLLQENTDLPIEYSQITGVDADRPHSSQLIVMYDYGTTDGLNQDFSDETFDAWYTPYLIPDSALTFNEATNQVVVGDLTTVTFKSADGLTTYQMPAFSPSSTKKATVYRSQDVNNIQQTFSAEGS